MSPRDEDLFAESTMSIPEHLEELRSALVKALLALAVGFIIGLYYAEWVVDFVRGPLDVALQEYYTEQAVKKVEAEYLEAKQRGESIPNLEIVREAVAREGMMPQEIWIDPQALIMELESGLEELPPGFALPPPRVVVATDIADLSAFANELQADLAAEGANAGKRLWALMGEVGEKTPVEAPPAAEPEAEGEEATEPPPPEQLTASQHAIRKLLADQKLTEAEEASIIQALNAIVRREDFYDEPSFEQALAAKAGLLGLFDTAKITNLAKLVAQRESLRGYEIGRMNAYLLDQSFDTYQPSGRMRSMIRLLQWMPVANDPRTGVQTLSVTEAFIVYIKAALLFGFVLASPLVFYFVWEFVASGLYKHERRYIYIFLPFSLGLFLLGASIAFFFVFQFVLSFLFEFNAIINAQPNIRMSEWLGFALLLPVGFGLAFQLPLVMLFLNRVGIIPAEAYWQYWRPAIMVIAVLSMVLTPADPGSMLIMFGSLTPLYYLGIKLCEWWPATRSPFPEPAEV